MAILMICLIISIKVWFKNLLSNFPNLYCSDDCYQNEDNKILQCNKTCIDDCQNDNIPYLSL